MRLRRPVLAALVLATVVPALPASAATTTTPAAGSGVTTATVLGVTAAGHSLAIGALSVGAQTVTSAAPSVTFVPANVDGTKLGAVTVTPANSPLTAGGVSTAPTVPSTVVSATSPSATLTASKPASGPVAGLTSGLGSLSVLGIPVTLNGSLTVGSVTDATHAQAGKTLTITNVALPSIADLIAALGIDLSALPVGTLDALVSTLPMTISSATQAAFDNANTAIAGGQTALDNAQTAYDTAATALTQAAADLDAQLNLVDTSAIDFTGTGVSAPLDHTDWDTLSTTGTGQAIQTTLETGNTPLTDAATAYDTAKSDVATAQAAVTAAVNALNALVATLVGIVDGVLSGTPLVQIGATTVSSVAKVVGTTPTASVTGTISGVKVLGQDVLQAVTGGSTLDVVSYLDTVASQVNTAINTATAALSTALSAVTGATGLVVPAPQVKFLTKSTTTGVDGAYRTAEATVTALSVSIGSVTVPVAFALPNAATLPGVTDLRTTFQTDPLSVTVGAVVDAARFRKASSSTPSGGGTLPATGAPAGLALAGMVGIGIAVGTVRYRRRLN